MLSLIQLEAYLLSADVLRALCLRHSQNPQQHFQELAQEMHALKESGTKIKAAVNILRKWTIQRLNVQNAGDTPESFLRDTLTPLIQPGMRTYEMLKQDIFNP